MGSKVSKADGEWLALGPLNANSGTCSAAISTTDACIQLAAGDWLVYVKGTATSSVDECCLKWGGANTVAAAVPGDTADNAAPTMTANTAMFPCTATERIKVSADNTFVSYVLSAGGTTSKIRFVRL